MRGRLIAGCHIVRGRVKEEGRRVGNPEAKAEPNSAGEAGSARTEGKHDLEREPWVSRGRWKRQFGSQQQL